MEGTLTKAGGVVGLETRKPAGRSSCFLLLQDPNQEEASSENGQSSLTAFELLGEGCSKGRCSKWSNETRTGNAWSYNLP